MGQVFTAGPLSMEFSSRLYGQAWTFEEQGLPKDLASRCSLRNWTAVILRHT